MPTLNEPQESGNESKKASCTDFPSVSLPLSDKENGNETGEIKEKEKVKEKTLFLLHRSHLLPPAHAETGRRALLADIRHFSVHDGPGIRTTFFLKGCPLRCRWCHNPETFSPTAQMAFYEQNCILCGECEKVCPSGAHRILPGTQRFLGQTQRSAGRKSAWDEESPAFTRHQFHRKLCTACGKCEEVCPSGALRLYGKEKSVSEMLEEALSDREFYDESGGGVTLSGGEPLLQAEFCRAFFSACRAEGIHTAVDSSCFAPRRALEDLLPYTDLFLADWKHPDPEVHEALTGQENALIRENLLFLAREGAVIEIRIPLVPGINDSEKDLKRSGEFLRRLNPCRVRLLAYHPLARTKYAALGIAGHFMEGITPPSDNDLRSAADFLRRYGLNAVPGWL